MPLRRAPLFTSQELEAAAELVHGFMPPTPQYAWPLLAQLTGCSVWVKHENHSPVGAFKLRGGLVYVDQLLHAGPRPNGLITATRGNHGQSIAVAGCRAGLPVTILVPHGNSADKNRAMRALGAEVVEHGVDFDEARLKADQMAAERGLHFVPSFDRHLVRGVATCAFEFFAAVTELDAVYVPIGMGSGICAAMAVRDLLSPGTEIIGVVAAAAPAMALSFEAGRIVPTKTARTFADGMACREPQPEPLERSAAGAARIVRTSEDEIAEAIRIYFDTTHNLAEGAGAAPLAALLKERDQMRGRKVGLILSGGNIDRGSIGEVLAGNTPQA